MLVREMMADPLLKKYRYLVVIEVFSADKCVGFNRVSQFYVSDM